MYRAPKLFFSGSDEEKEAFQKIAEGWKDGDLLGRSACTAMAFKHIRIAGCSAPDETLVDLIGRLGDYDSGKMSSVVAWLQQEYKNRKIDTYREGAAIGLGTEAEDGEEREVEYRAEGEGETSPDQVARIWDRLVVARANALKAEGILSSENARRQSLWNHITFTEFATKAVKIHREEADVAASKMEQHGGDVLDCMDLRLLDYLLDAVCRQILEIFRAELKHGSLKENGYWLLKGTELAEYLRDAKKNKVYDPELGQTEENVSQHRTNFENSMRIPMGEEFARLRYDS